VQKGLEKAGEGSLKNGAKPPKEKGGKYELFVT
jgi:hypothetical protein